MIVLGADTHKRSHTFAAVVADSGELLGDQIVVVGMRGFEALLRWARGLDGERVWALEDCRHVSGGLERFLIARGERLLRIPTHLTASARRSSRQRGKSDPIDALTVARVALQEGFAPSRSRTWMGPNSICGCSSITATASCASASRSTARCSGTFTTSGPNSRSPVARCSRRNGRRRSPGASRARSRRCACGSPATSCDASAS